MSTDCNLEPDMFLLDDMLTDEHKIIRETVRKFVQDTIQPQIQACYRQEKFPTSIIPSLGQLGLFGPNLKGYNLPGLDNIAYGLIMKELERCDSGLRSFASVQSALSMYPIYQYGSEQQKNTWLKKLGQGEAIGCFGLTEPDGGSDPSNMKTTANFDGGHWHLNGAKMWITNGNLAHIAVVWAQTKDGIRGFLVPCDSEGVSVKLMTGKLSLRASVTSELIFRNVKLPSSALLAKSNGVKHALSCLTQARYGIAWGVIGAAEACFHEVVNYVKDRQLFGQALACKQLIQSKLATMLSKITQGQLLAFRLGQLKDAGKITFTQVSMAKQANCEMALEVARTCRDMLGANGIMDEYCTMRHMCNLETVKTYEGTNDIHLLIIGAKITGYNAY